MITTGLTTHCQEIGVRCVSVSQQNQLKHLSVSFFGAATQQIANWFEQSKCLPEKKKESHIQDSKILSKCKNPSKFKAKIEPTLLSVLPWEYIALDLPDLIVYISSLSLVLGLVLQIVVTAMQFHLLLSFLHLLIKMVKMVTWQAKKRIHLLS